MDDNVQAEYIKTDGTPIDPNNCVQTDHIVTTFSVTIRHLDMLGADQIKAELQKRFEVLNSERTACTVVCR